MKFANVSSPLSAHEILRTSCPAAALETMASFGAKIMRPHFNRGFCLKVDAISMQNVVLAHGYHGEGTVTSYDTTDYYWQAFAITGTCKQSSGRVDRQLDSNNWSALYSPHQLLESEAGAGYQQLTAKINARGVRRVLSSLIGREVESLSIDEQAPPSSPRLQSMRRQVFSLASELDAIADRCFAAVLLELEQALILSFVLSHHHNHTSFILTEPKAPSPAQLAIAEEYIAANWDKPLDVSVLAQVCNVSARSIFRYFRDRRGCSPMEFIRSKRLEHARTNLLKADEGTSVVATALKAGFTSLGHFARNYRTIYGENPSETLDRALRLSGKTSKKSQASIGPTRKRGW